MTPLTMRPRPAPRPHKLAPAVRSAHNPEPPRVREARLRRRAGAAYTRLAGTVEAQAAAIGRTYTAMVHRRQGRAGLANVLLEVDAHEREGRDTQPLIEALIETRLEARAARVAATLSPVQLGAEEAALDGAEDLAQARFHLTGCPREWGAAIRRYIAWAESTLLPALLAHPSGRTP